MPDGQVEIRLVAALDSSLAAATAEAANLIDELNEKALQAAAASGSASTAQTVKSLDDMVAQLTQAMNAMTAAKSAQTANAQKEDQKQANSWRTVCSEITRAEGQLVSDVFSKRQSLAADLQKIGLRLVESEITNALKTLTTHEMANLGKLSSDKNASQEGLIYQLGSYLAGELGFTQTEVAKTVAQETGVDTRNAVQSAGNAVGLAEQSATASTVIASDAAQAASGSYSSASQVPYVGWLIAPAAAATAAAAVMAYAEGGQLRVNAAQQPTMLHKDEMVWPGWAAHGARNMLASFSNDDFAVPRGGDTFNRSQSDATSHQWNYAPTIHGVPERNVMDELRNNSAEFMSFVRGLSRGGSMKFG